MVRPFRSILPTIHPSAFIDESAQVIGDVHVGAESSVWMATVVRGDVNFIRIGARTNLQDGTIVHVMRETHPTHIGDDVTIGHGAIVHGCTIEDRCLIGMGAVLLNGCRIGSGSIVAAGALVPEGMEVPPGSMVMGMPAKVRRALTTAEDASIKWYADNYVRYRLDFQPGVGPGLTAMARTEPARGMRDFLPEDVRRRAHVIGIVARVYERYGFEPLETPAVENIDTLLGKYGDEGNQLIFKILKRGEHAASGQADLALRYDLTVPLARVMAEHRAKLPRIFRRYQIQPVWRADRPARGRFREFYQCDVDALGSTSPVAEAELCAAVSDVLAELGFQDFVIRVNHRELLRAVLNAVGIAEAQHGSALVALDKLDKIGLAGVSAELAQRGIASESMEGLRRVFGGSPAAGTTPSLEGLSAAVDGAAQETLFEEPRPSVSVPPPVPTGATLDEVEALFVGLGQPVPAAMGNLRDILRLAEHTSAQGRLRFDPSLARGLSYYTGAIMEVAVPDLAGSLGGGGRYDNLVGMFSGETVPAVGFSLGLERILVVMGERGMFPADLSGAPADVLALPMRPDDTGYALRVAAALRRCGLRVMVYPDPDKIGKQIKYASSRGIPCVAILGESESARDEVTLKFLATGHQEVAALDVAGAAVLAAMGKTLGEARG